MPASIPARMQLQVQPVARIRARISPPSFQNPTCQVRGAIETWLPR